jgi:ElaB/YqjD/DUF883 family membrane-anchored ribosome-binding protein
MNGNGNGNRAAAEVRGAAQTAVDDAFDGAEAVRASARAEFNKLAADVEDLVRKVAHVTDADIARVRERVEEKLASTRRFVEEGSARMRAQGLQLAERTDGYVHERPWTALGIAAAVGILIGVLSARR